MRGFLSFDEYFNADRTRHDPDHTPWLEYFVGTLGQAARALHERAARLYQAMAPPAPPWEGLSRRQQQQRTRLLARAIAGTHGATEVQAPEVHGWFGVSGNTAREWLSEWDGHGLPCAGSRPRGRAREEIPSIAQVGKARGTSQA
jgi:hypothetical protein